MPMFSYAQDTTINGGQFYDITQNPTSEGLSGVESDARYDSAYRQASGARCCDIDTQEPVLEEIMGWIHGDHSNSRVLWLAGPVGAGKSTIAHTIADRCATDGLLAASFFFPYSGMGHYWWKNVIPTMAAQFRSTVPGFEGRLKSVLTHGDPSPLRIEAQANLLITEPLRSIQLSTPMVVIIDGLEQCEAYHKNSLHERQALQSSLMEVLLKSLETQSRICVIISSRFENHLAKLFTSSPVLVHFSQTICLDSASEKDLAVVLRAGLKSMQGDPTIGIENHWPDDKTIGALVWRCSGQFTYAIAVLRFIAPHPRERLQHILGRVKGDHIDPFEQLDDLYRQILQVIPLDLRQALLRALGAVVFLRHPPSIQFLQSYTGRLDIFIPLLDLQSVLHVRQLIPYRVDNSDTIAPIRVRHGSFIEFLLNRSRSGPFFIDANAHHTQLTCFFLEIMHRSTEDSPLLQYATKHWCYHCTRSTPNEILLKALCDFDLSKWLASALALDATQERPSIDGLAVVVKWLHSKCTAKDSRILDRKYLKIFDQAVKEILEHCRHTNTAAQVLALLVVAPRPLTIREIKDILDVTPDHLSESIAWLTPKLLIADADQYSIEFSSVVDYLTDRKRSGRKFSVDAAAEYGKLAIRCLEGLSMDDTTSLFFFSLEYWTYFLVKCKPSKTILEFLRTLPTENASSKRDVQRVVQWLQGNESHISAQRLLQRWEPELNIER